MVHCVSSSIAESEPSDSDWNASEKQKPHSASSPSTSGPDSYLCDSKPVGSDIFVESSSNLLALQNQQQAQHQHVMYTYGDVGVNRSSLKRKHSIGEDTYAMGSQSKTHAHMNHHNQQLRKADNVGSGE